MTQNVIPHEMEEKDSFKFAETGTTDRSAFGARAGPQGETSSKRQGLQSVLRGSQGHGSETLRCVLFPLTCLYVHNRLLFFCCQESSRRQPKPLGNSRAGSKKEAGKEQTWAAVNDDGNLPE